MTVALLVLRSQAYAHGVVSTPSGLNRGLAPSSSTRVPERFEQTAENFWAVAGEAATERLIRAGMRERMGSGGLQGGKDG